MDITKLSSKGQIVIPQSMREDLDVGTPFFVSRKDDLIILKTIKPKLTKKEKAEAEELRKIWEEIDKGNSIVSTWDEFAEQMDKWRDEARKRESIRKKNKTFRLATKQKTKESNRKNKKQPLHRKTS